MLLPLWLMVLPFYRIDASFVADVICQGGRWNSLPGWVMLWSDVITISNRWNGHRVLFCFSLSSGLLHRTLSHMRGRWYLPVFLFGDGLLTLMYRASFMVLIRFWSSLPTMLKLSMLTSWPDLFEWSYIGEGAFRCSLNLSANVLADSPVYSSSHSTLSIYIYIWLHSFSGCDLYPLEPLGGFDGETSFEMHLYPILLAWSFYALTETLIVWNHHIWVFPAAIVLLVVVVVSSFVVGVLASHFYSVQGPGGVFAFL